MDGFFDHVASMWFARADDHEQWIIVQNGLERDDALRRKIATEVVNERGHVGGNFGKNKE
jgi:hypothetical protein